MTSPTADGQGWRPISEAGIDEKVLMWTPAENLYEASEKGEPWFVPEMRVSTRRCWTWATHFKPLPSPPTSGGTP